MADPLTAAPAPEVAIVGMAGRFPGANTPDELWELVRNGREAVRRLSDAELLAAGVSRELLRAPNYVKAAATLDGMDQFDPAFFGLSPRDGSIMDPQHRHFLECAWEALERAGYVPESFSGSIGVFGGCGMQGYFAFNLLNNPAFMRSAGFFLVRHTGNDKDFLTTRVSYQLNLRGPSVSVQTACSTSLVAVHLACQSLLNGECDMALAGGVTIELPHGHGYLYEPDEILSPDGHCRAFDSESQGTVFGSGVGIVVLRRLEDAVAARDHIHAVIRGSAVNNDGAGKMGYLAPSVDGQAAAIAEALAIAGVSAETIGYVEAHGTGTPIGDPIEIAALTSAFRKHTDRRGYCAVGSLKTNIGHLDTAAGVASLIKAVSAIEAAELPPSLHFTKPNPAIAFEETPFVVNAARRPWSSTGPRRAGVSSLGVGGTNAHVIIEQAPEAASPAPDGRQHALLLLSARSERALAASAERLSTRLRRPGLDLADAAYTLHTGRRRFAHRLAVVCGSAEEGADLLLQDAGPMVRRGTSAEAPPRVAFMFPGGGAQFPGMGAQLYDREPAFRSAFDRAVAAAAPHTSVDLRAAVLDPAASPAHLERPSVALPSLFAVEYALAMLVQDWGVKPAACIGHSLGEYVAACLASVLSLDDAMRLVVARGALFERVPAGAMASVPLSEHDVRALLPDELSVAAANAPAYSVVSGPAAAVDAFTQVLAARGVEGQRLRIAVAAHSAMLDPFLPDFLRVVQSIALSPPALPFVSNVTGTWITPGQATSASYWVDHLRSTVQFSRGVRTLMEDPSTLFAELGPGTALASLVGFHDEAGAAPRAVSVLGRSEGVDASHATVLAAAGQLWTRGVMLDPIVAGGAGRRRVPLPTYPFEHQRCWIDAAPRQGAVPMPTMSEQAAKTDGWLHVPIWTRSSRTAGRGAALAASRWLVVPADDDFSRAVVEWLESRCAALWQIPHGPASDVGSAVEALAGQGAAPTHVLYLRAAVPAAGKETVARLAESEDRAFYALLGLAKGLASLPEGDGIALSVITIGLQPVGGDSVDDPVRALATGAVRVIPQELPHVSARAIDLSAADVAAAFAPGRDRAALIELMAGEALIAAADPVVALRQGDRWTTSFRRIDAHANGGVAAVKEGGVYLITGGLGGIALTIADALARTARVRLVLASRSGLVGAAGSNQVTRIRALEAQGAEVVVIRADIADPVDAARLVGDIRTRFGRLDGVVHTAGVLADALIALKSDEDAARVLRPKVRGTLVLHQAIGGQPLDFWINCSSLSALVGIAGQFDYAAANAFLDAYSHWAAARGAAPMMSVNWSAWQGVGMLAAASGDDTAEGRPVDAPLLSDHRRDGDTDVFRMTFDLDRDWVVHEHRLLDGTALLPGTGFLQMAVSAVRHGAPDEAVELTDVMFMAPFVVGDTGRTIFLERDRTTGEFVMRSRADRPGGEDTEHVRGVARVAAPSRLAAEDLERIRRRCVRLTPAPSPNLTHLRVGPRWGSRLDVRLGDGEAFATIEMPQAFAGETMQFDLHPALFDVATAFGLWLAPGYSPESEFCVPQSYGRLELLRPLPARVCAYARLRREDTDAGAVVLDVRLFDPDGQPVARVDRFVMKRLPPAVALGAGSTLRPASIRPRQGADIFLRLLRLLPLPQVAAGPQWVDELAAARRPGQAGGRPARRPARSSPLVEPRDETERQVAAIWCEMLGVDEVSLDDNFFALGGHSLLLAQVASRIRRNLGASATLTALFERPTVRHMSDLCRAPAARDDEPALVAVRRDALRMSRTKLDASSDRWETSKKT